MKKLKTLLILTSTICLIFSNAQEEEIKTVKRNGVEYKINPQSGHQTPLNPTVQEEKMIENSTNNYYIDFHLGQVSPLGENLRHSYNPGYSFGLNITTPTTFNFLTKNWNLHALLNFSKLSANNSNTNSNINMINIGSTVSTSFGPILINAGLALTPFMSSYFDNGIKKNDNKIFISLIGSISYKIFQRNDFGVILNLNFQEIFGSVRQSSDGTYGTSEIYGLNIVVDKGFNF